MMESKKGEKSQDKDRVSLLKKQEKQIIKSNPAQESKGRLMRGRFKQKTSS